MQVIGLFLELGDPEWVTWFALGEYVRVLTLSSRVSQQLGLRLADVAEADEAVDVLRQLVDQLESYGVAAPVLQVLHRIQDLLQGSRGGGDSRADRSAAGVALRVA